MYYHHMYAPGMDFGWGFPLIGLLVQVLFWVLVIWLVYRLLTHRGIMHLHHDYGPTDPVEAAKMRYAKGEITKAEFEEIKKNLKD